MSHQTTALKRVLSRWLCSATVFMIATASWAADVNVFALYKRQSYEQSSAAAPIQSASNKFVFVTFVTPSANGFVTNAGVTLPNSIQKNLTNSGSDFRLVTSVPPGGGAAIATLAAFNVAYPSGNYTVRMNTLHDGLRQVPLNLTGDTYPNVPQIINFNAAQSINPAANFTLNWNSFVGGTANDAIQVSITTTNEVPVSVFDSLPPGTTGGLTGQSNAIVIPANSLEPGETYRANLFFGKIVTLNISDYQGVPGVSGYGIATTFLIRTTGTAEPPTISSQPQDKTVKAGLNAAFNAAANGNQPLQFQWRFKGTNIWGANATSLTINNAQPADAGEYTLVVTNNHGAITSAVATLSVYFPPTIVQQPQPAPAVAGTSVTFNVEPGGTPPFSYRWRFNGATIPGKTEQSLLLNNVQSGDVGNYSVVITNMVGSVTSSVAALTLGLPPSLTSTLTNQTVISGANVSMSATASGTGTFGYEWFFNGAKLSEGSTLSLKNVKPSATGLYSVRATNPFGFAISPPALLTVLPLTNVPACIPSPAGLVSWWTADLNANDLQGTNHGSFQNGASIGPGMNGQAFTLDGNNDFVQVPHSDSLNITDEITIAAWIKTASVTGKIFDKHTVAGNNGYLADITAGKFRFNIGATTLSTTQSIPLNTFTHVAGVFSGSQLRLYINGVLDKSGAGPASIPSNTLPLRIGANSVGTNTFNGQIDEVLLFNRALTSQEIQTIATAGAAGLCKGASIVFATNASHFSIGIKGRTGAAIQIQASTNLVHWQTLGTVTTNITGNILYSDPSSGFIPQRFYRAIAE